MPRIGIGRNALRQRVVPALISVADGYPATIARAAAHQAEAARLLDDLAALDAAPLLDNGTLDRAGLAALPTYRARNVLRHFLQRHGLRPPSTARLDAMLVQLRTPRPDARVRFAHEGAWFGVFRGRVIVHRAAPSFYERDVARRALRRSPAWTARVRQHARRGAVGNVSWRAVG